MRKIDRLTPEQLVALLTRWLIEAVAENLPGDDADVIELPVKN